MNRGIFTISLDFELYWGMLDVCSANEMADDLFGTAFAVQEMLRLFKQYRIHATWATVGLLFAKNTEEAIRYSPTVLPHYQNKKLDAHKYLREYLQDNQQLEPQFHFAPELIKQIQATEGQEIATHTFSHYYCLEEKPSADAFRADLVAAINIAKQQGIELKSLVFPRNQWSSECLLILKELGISSYRGNEKHWMYQPLSEKKITFIRRIIKQLDAVINLSGFNTYPIKTSQQQPINIPASRQLRSHGKWLSFLDRAKLKRICDAMEHAAKQGEVFHLWWHPEDFGVQTESRIIFLEKILKKYQQLQNQYGMQALNMAEISTISG